MMPEFYCKNCNILLCEDCHDDSKSNKSLDVVHDKKNHKVKSISDVDLSIIILKKKMMKDELLDKIAELSIK